MIILSYIRSCAINTYYFIENFKQKKKKPDVNILFNRIIKVVIIYDAQDIAVNIKLAFLVTFSSFLFLFYPFSFSSFL